MGQVIPSASQAPDPKYNRSEFEYNEIEDSYICPEGQTLTPAPCTYSHRNSSRPEYTYTFKKYRTKACKSCPVRKHCTRSNINGRHIDRTEYTGAIQRNKERIQHSENYYKRRQAIVEHPYEDRLVSDLSEIRGCKPTFKRKESNHQIRVGCKRQKGFDHIMTKRKIGPAIIRCGINAECL